MRHYPTLTWTLLVAMTLSSLATAAPGTIPIRGQLLDGEGVPLAGARDYVVQFYDAETDGTALGGELIGTATLSAEGLFTLSVTPPQEMLSSAAVWYAIAVDSDATPNGIDANDWFAERAKVESVPFALQAGEVEHVDAAAIANGSVSDMEFEALDGVSGDIQSQLDAKLEATDIDATTAATATNTAGIAANTADIATNGTNITTNAAAVATKADAASVDASQAVQDAVIGMNASNIVILDNSSAVNAEDIVDNADAIATKAATADVLPRVGSAHVLVTITDNTTTNGTNLLAAYTAAKVLTPHGATLSATNRGVVIVPPGSYDLGTAELTLDTEFVDLVGLTTNRDAQHIFGTSDGANTGVLGQTADDVRIENLVIECTRTSDVLSYDSTDPAAYYPDTHGANTRFRNCEFRADDTNGSAKAWTMRRGVEYAGSYVNCTGGDFSFGGAGGTASGTFTNCIAGTWSFGFQGTASGTFTHCTGGNFSFAGSGGTASGTFFDCSGAYGSFGGTGGTASGTFIHCTGTSESFGGAGGTASGTFTDCTGGPRSFGGTSLAGPGTASGTFTNCTGGSYTFGGTGGDATGGKFYFCRGGTSSFTTTGSPTVLYCVRNGAAYP